MYQFRVELHKAVTQKINFSDLHWVTDDENPVHFLMFLYFTFETRYSYTVLYKVLILSRQQTWIFKTLFQNLK